MASLSGQTNYQELSDLGILLAGGRLYTYLPGTTTHTNVYTDAAGAVPHTYTSDGSGGQYVALNARGEVPGNIFVNSGGVDLVTKTPAGVTIKTRKAIGQSDADALFRADLADTASAAKGDDLVGRNRTFTGAVGHTQHDWSERQQITFDVELSADNTGVTSVSTKLAQALTSGVRRIYVPPGTYALATVVTATLANDVVIYGEGSFVYTGANSIDNLITIQCAGNSLRVQGLSFDGDNLITGGLRVENTSAMVDPIPDCEIEGNLFTDFRMNAASIWNQAAYVAGAFGRVVIRGNTVRNITRAAGTGDVTVGIYVENQGATRYVRECIHEENSYINITGDDLVGSAANVGYDGFKFFAPDPTTNDNSDNTVSSYVPSTCKSSKNTYRNCRGRALKIQAIGIVENEKIIRDADYTIFGASTEINLQYGAGMVRDCEFFYKDYLVGGVTVTSPLQTSLHLVSFFQGTWYDEVNGGCSVSGLRVYNNIKTGVGNSISQIVAASVGAGVVAKDKPLVYVSDVVVNRGDVDWILAITSDTGADGLVRLDSISVPKLTYGAIGSDFLNQGIKVLATNIFNLDGVTTPANAKKFVTDTTTPGGDISFSGVLAGSCNYGFLNTYNRGADFTYAPMLVDAALTGSGTGGAASVQNITLADDASHTFERRFFNSGRGLIIVSVNFDYTTHGVFAIGSNEIHQIAAHASDLFTPSTTGSNLDVDGQLNLWFTGGQLRIKNRLGGSFTTTVLFVG